MNAGFITSWSDFVHANELVVRDLDTHKALPDLVLRDRFSESHLTSVTGFLERTFGLKFGRSPKPLEIAISSLEFWILTQKSISMRILAISLGFGCHVIVSQPTIGTP
jgi:hypothetical protein